MSSVPKAPPQGPSLARSAVFAAPALPIGAISVAVFVYLPNYFAGHLGVPLAVIGFMWMAVRLVDLPVDTLVALAMDRTRTRFGRYKLWLLAGAPVLAAAILMLFMAPAHIDGAYLLAWLFVMYLGTSMISLAHPAWGATLATRHHDRSRLFAFLTAAQVVGTLAILALSIFHQALGLTDAGAVRAMGWTIAAAVPATALLAFLTTPERIAPEPPADARSRPPGPAAALRDLASVYGKPEVLRLFFVQMALTLGPGWMSALYLFFFTAARGFTTAQSSLLLALYIAAGLPGALLTARISRRFGKHRTLMATTTAFSLALFSIFIIPKANLAATAPVMLWCGAMAAGFDLMVRSMLADVGDAVRLDQRKERLSLLYASNTLASKLAAGLAIGLTYPLLQALGFNPAEGVVNTPQAIMRLQIAFLGGPIVFVVMGGACLIGWRLDARRHGAIRQALDARDADFQAPPALGLATGYQAAEDRLESAVLAPSPTTGA